MERKIYLKNQTVYQIYVRNHTKEGTFLSLINDLPRIKALGVSILYLLPINPIGEVARKGDLGSPYAIKDYYLINPELGTLADFKAFLKAAHQLGFKVILDIVLHHTSPDAILLKEHPDFYFYKNGKLGNKVGDWSDIIDLDYGNRKLWDYMLEMLTYWVKIGVDGFRADVAPIIPIAFWDYIRASLNVKHPQLIWLSESVEPHFLSYLRENNHIGHEDKDLYSAFDVLYDYDVYPSLKAFLVEGKPLKVYLDGVRYQEKEYPRGYLKIRTIENHDTLRIKDLCKNESILKNVTAWSFFQNGVGYLYAGQEVKAVHRPSLFDVDKVDLTIRDEDFYAFIISLVEIKKRPIFRNYLQYEIKEAVTDKVIFAMLSNEDEKAMGFFNLSGAPVRVKAPLEDGTYINLINDEEVYIKKGYLVVSDPVIFLI